MKSQTLMRVVLGTAIGLIIGVGGYTFIYARGYSYLTNDPAACANCHVIQDYYNAWQKSSHHSVASHEEVEQSNRGEFSARR